MEHLSKFSNNICKPDPKLKQFKILGKTRVQRWPLDLTVLIDIYKKLYFCITILWPPVINNFNRIKKPQSKSSQMIVIKVHVNVCFRKRFYAFYIQCTQVVFLQYDTNFHKISSTWPKGCSTLRKVLVFMPKIFFSFFQSHNWSHQ